MGGHLMLRHVVERVPPVSALVLSSPMITFRVPLPESFVRKIAGAMVRHGRAERYAWGQGARPATMPSIRQRRLTGDIGRYSDELWWNEQNPAHVLGGADRQSTRLNYSHYCESSRPYSA